MMPPFCHVADHVAVVVSHARQMRTAVEVLATLQRNLPGVDLAALEACANNLAAAWGEYGVEPQSPDLPSSR